MAYILRKHTETVEVLEGREGRRDQLVRAGYVWVNKPMPPVDVSHVFSGAPDPDEVVEVLPLRKDKRGS